MNSREFYICSLRRRLTLRGIIGNVISSLNSFCVYMLTDEIEENGCPSSVENHDSDSRCMAQHAVCIKILGIAKVRIVM